MRLAARYSCSISTTRASACGRVSRDSDQRRFARPNTGSSRPSAPPTINASCAPVAWCPPQPLRQLHGGELLTLLIQRDHNLALRQLRQNLLSFGRAGARAGIGALTATRRRQLNQRQTPGRPQSTAVILAGRISPTQACVCRPRSHAVSQQPVTARRCAAAWAWR